MVSSNVIVNDNPFMNPIINIMLKNRLTLMTMLLLISAFVSSIYAQPICSVDIIERKDPSNPGVVYLLADATGQPGFMYMWSTNETTRRIEVTRSGDYCVTVTDSLGCTARECKDVVISGANCEVKIKVDRGGIGTNLGWLLTASGEGEEPFSFEWSTGETTEQIKVNQPGRYCVTMTDNSGCEAVACAVADTASRNCAVIINEIKGGIGSNTGDTYLLAIGKGQEPISYLWNTGDTTRRIVADSSGLYCVTITDSVGCVADTCIDVVINPQNCDVEIRRIELNLAGNKNYLLLATGKGVLPINYKWSTGETGRAILVDSTGEYCVTITDATGCTAEECIKVVIATPQDCDVNILQRNLLGPLGGGLLIAMPRGVAPFKFLWNTGERNRVLIATKPGEYCVTMVDARGCEAEACIKFGNINDSCDVKIIKLPSSTASGLYTLRANASGANPVKYTWSTGDTTEFITVNTPGRYCVKILDASGCTSSACIDIKKDDCDVKIRPFVDSITNVLSLTAIASGSPPFKYEWNTGETGPTIRVTKSGKYCVKIVDSIGCVAEACYNYKFTRDTCNVRILSRRTGSNTGVYLVAEPFGNGPFKFKWSTGDTSRQILVNGPGRYCVEVKTADGCVASACVKFDGQVVIPDFTRGGPVSFTLYPNPVSDILYLKRAEFGDASIVRIMRRDGYISLQKEWPNDTYELSLDVYNLIPGSYFIQVISKDQVMTKPFFKQ